ncbi:polyprenol monophosphomannose synthase [Legionella quinlivanii]|uniref:polyprenol monophosphomannose synthase n=1 Tax=Legionella quinlivanii TaxID=45073 RepID=UPI002243725C|nr:polyprenol monophosphomannose synthase [Legionella quinlivanii]MCW8452445.1 polyprenol monophosphomannose synthase [Legionella quinlivanii]
MSIRSAVIIIPTFNESATIEKTLHQVFQSVSSSALVFYVLVFDSGSIDQTREIVLRLQSMYPRLYLKTEPCKTGLGSAYMQAMRYALSDLKADIIIEFDADLSHQPHYLLPMVEQLANYDVVVGSRYIAGGSIPSNWGWYRRLLSKAGNWLCQTILTSQYKDFTSGFRACHSQVLNRALPEQFISNDFAYKLELFWLLHKTQARIMEYPIAFIDRAKGRSKLPANSILDSLRVLFILLVMPPMNDIPCSKTE